MIENKPITSYGPRFAIEAEREAEVEELAALEAMRRHDSVDAYRAAQDEALWKKLKRLSHSNHALWRELSPIERRLLLDFAVAQVHELEERIGFMSRNLAVGELEVPSLIQAEA